jgi:hypothetical protein
MSESRADEHERLLRRTNELREQTANLDRAVTPFDQAAHERLNAALEQHLADLAAHRHTPASRSNG